MTLFQKICPAYVDRTASSTPTLLRQRMCASRQSDRCLEAMMLQLQCNYYNGKEASGSNASGRQSKTRYSSNYGGEAAKGQFLHRGCRSKGRLSCSNSRHEDVSKSRAVANHGSDDLDTALSPGCPESSSVIPGGLEIRDGPVGGLTPEG